MSLFFAGGWRLSLHQLIAVASGDAVGVWLPHTSSVALCLSVHTVWLLSCHRCHWLSGDKTRSAMKQNLADRKVVKLSNAKTLELKDDHWQLMSDLLPVLVPSVLWRCWLGGRKGIRPVKNRVVGCWHGYLSGARCRLAYGPADATVTHCLLLQ